MPWELCARKRLQEIARPATGEVAACGTGDSVGRMQQPTPDGAPRRFASAVAGILAFSAVVGVGLVAPVTASAASSKTTRVAATKTTRVAATTTVRPLPTTTTEAAKDVKTDIERKIVAGQPAEQRRLSLFQKMGP